VSEHAAPAAERAALREVVRRFVEREVQPTVAERERSSSYPSDLLPGLAAMGVLGMSIPAEHGGSELDMVSFAMVFEELARGWMGLASVVGSSGSGSWLIARYGTDAQRSMYLPDLAGGRRMSGIALTEPSTGSNLKGITTTAIRDGDQYILNGTKTMITQARHADPLVVLVVTNPSATPSHHGISLMLVERDTPGCVVTEIG
jgi:alkylation response protein AidB-like acyl-CoA dehydrogenase